MDPHASFPHGQSNGFRNPYQSYPAAPMNPNGIFLGSAVSQNLSYTPMYQGFFPNHAGSQVGYQNPPSFMFRERKGRVNWRNIASLDVDELVGKGDIRMLESYLSNIAFSNLEKEDIESFGDVNLLKLFRLSQYSLEYLLNCQNYLASQAQALDFQYRASEEQLCPLEEQARRNQAEILNLKNEINQKKDLVKVYQNSLNNPVYKCHLCTKMFKSQDFLANHFQTRHGDALAKSKKSPKADTAQTQQETAKAVEKLMTQLKQNEDLRLSQLSSTLQDRLQEVIKSNKELTAKVAEMEKKMDLERDSVGSPDQPFNRTLRQEVRGAPQGQSIGDIQSRQTPKKHGFPETAGGPDSPIRQVFRAGELEEGGAFERQNFKAGSLKDLEEDERQKRQAFNAGSLRDIDEDEESLKGPSVKSLRNVNREHQRQLFRAGELQDIEEGEITPRNEVQKKVGKSKKQDFKAGSLHNLDDDEDDEEVVAVRGSNVNKKQEGVKAGGRREAKSGPQRQVFNAGELQSELKVAKGVNKYYAGALEDDNDFAEARSRKKSEEGLVEAKNRKKSHEEVVEARNRKRSQEDFVVMEEEGEDEEEHGGRNSNGKREAREAKGARASRGEVIDTEGLDEDEIREKHKSAVAKAMNLIKNKYVHPITTEEYEKAEKQVDKDLKTKCSKILKVDYDKLKEQSNDDLSNMEKTLKSYTQKDAASMEKLHNEYQNTTNQVQQPNNKNHDSKSKNKLAQSSELMNLVVDHEKSGKKLKDSVADKKKQVFESQNLDSELGSYEDLKNRHAKAAKENGTNLMKKSIQGGVAEYL